MTTHSSLYYCSLISFELNTMFCTRFIVRWMNDEKLKEKKKKNKSILPTWSDDFYFYFLSLNVPISFFCSHSFANVKITAIIHKIELNLHGSLRPITAFNTISISFLTNALHIQFVHLSLKCFGFFLLNFMQF